MSSIRVRAFLAALSLSALWISVFAGPTAYN